MKTANNDYFRYTLASPKTTWQVVRLTRPANSSWLHVIVNFLGLDGYQPLRVFHNEVQHQNERTSIFRPTRYFNPSDKIVVGKVFYGNYALFDIDELVFIDHALSSEERARLRQT